MEWLPAGVVVSVVLAFGGWVFWLVRDLRADIRQQHQELRADMRQQHQDLLAVLQGHTHSAEGTAVFHQLTASA